MACGQFDALRTTAMVHVVLPECCQYLQEECICQFGSPPGQQYENGRNIRVKRHNALTETEWVADDILAFEAGGSEGTLDAPFILHFSKADEVDLESAGHLMAYPNPFNNELVIHWHGTEPLKDLVIEDSRGRRVADLSCNDILNGPCRWNAAGIEGGVYFIHATTETRNYTLRVVK